MNLGTGVFTAPQAGRYFFSFTGVKEDKDGFGLEEHMMVSLRKNGADIGNAAGATHERMRSYESMLYEFDYTFSLQATLDLKKGDTVSVFLKKGVIKGSIFNHFTGFLLDEDLEL